MATLSTHGAAVVVAEPAVAPQTGAAPAATRTLDESLLHSVAWTGAVKWAVQLFTWVSTFVVARLLTPVDYGIIGMAAVFLGLVTMLSEFGIGITVVTMRELTRSQVAQLNGLALLLGLAATGVGCLAAVPLGHFFHSTQLPPVVVALSAAFLITSCKVVPTALLQRELQFKLLALLDGVQGLAHAVCTIVLAWQGFGYWSLVFGAIVGQVVATALILVWRRHAFAWPQAQVLQAALTFSRHQTTGSLAWYVYTNADFLIAGRILGVWSLGVYTMASTLARTLPEKVTSLVVRVTPAFFSAVQDNPAALRRYVLRLSEYLAMITFPAMLGIALTAEDLLALLGEQWASAVMPLRLLALFAAYESILQLLPRALTATRETRFLMRDGLALALFMPAALLFGSRWGASGMAATWLCAYPLTRIPTIRLACRKLEMKFREYLQAFVPASAGCACMSAALLILQFALADWQPVARFALEVAVGAAVYMSCIMLFFRSRLIALYRMSRTLREEL